MSARLLSIIAVVVVAAALISQAIEQGTKGAYSTPGLLGNLAVIAVGGLFTGTGIALITAANNNPTHNKRRKK